MANRLKERYTAEIAPALNKKFGYKSVMQIPKLDKVNVNVGCGESKNNAKEIEAICKDIATIIGQKHVTRKARKSVANFKLREGEAGGIVKKETPIRACKVALYCDKCGKGVRVGYKVDGDKKTRICRKCGAEI